MPGSETKFFLSYAREDAQAALKLAKELRAAGANLWVDQLDIRAGDHWDRAVQKGLETCGGMLLILSPDAVASENVMDEVGYALDQGKRVVPVIVRECEIPFRLRRVQYIDFAGAGEEAGVAQLRDELAKGEPEAAPAEEQAPRSQEPQREAAEAAGARLGARRRLGFDLRRRALWLAPFLLGGLVLLGMLIAWQKWASVRRVQIAAEERATREQEAAKEQGRQAELERARQTEVVAKEPAKRDEEPERQQEKQAVPEGEAKPLAGMVPIPAGKFWMGCNERVDQECRPNEPGRSVSVDAFSIDRTEVTVAEYRKCVQAGKCTPPDTGQQCNWAQTARDDHPINCVDWSQAKAYCEWAGKRLPTEAEWEKAARGTEGFKYPWGNEKFDSAHPQANIGATNWGTMPVGSYPVSKAYSLQDMAGNVAEWVADNVGFGRGLRGGSWQNFSDQARASLRNSSAPGYRNPNIGFRCAQQ